MATPISYKDPVWDAAEAEASKATGVPAEVIKAIRLAGEKSNSDQVSPKGAKGVYQFMPTTERLFAKKYGVSAYSDNPVEQATAAAYHLKDSYSRTKDWALAAAGYNGGPAGEKNPHFTAETSAYYARVKEALGQPYTSGPASPGDSEPAGVTRRGAPTWAEYMAGDTKPLANDPVPVPTVEGDAPAAPLTQAAPLFQSSTNAAATALSLEQQAEQTKVDTQKFGLLSPLDRETTVGAAVSDTLAPYWSFLDKAGLPADPEYLKAVARDPASAFAGVDNPTADEQEDLLDARSEEERRAVVARIQTRREDAKVMSRAGTAEFIGAGLVAGALDPMTYVAGYGAAKAFYATGRGAYVLAQAGRRGAAMASLVAENAVGNVAYEAARQTLGEHRTLSDYALAAATGIFPAALGVPGLNARVAKYHADVADAVLAKQEAYLKRAADQLGEAAEPEAVRKLAAQLEFEDSMEVLNSTRVRENRIVAPDIDDPDFIARVQDEAGVAGAEIPPARGDESPYFNNDTKAVADIQLEARVEQLGLSRSADEIRNLAPGLHLGNEVANSPAFKEIAGLLEGLRAKYAPDLAIHVGRGTDANLGSLQGGAISAGPGKHIILLKPGEGMQPTAIHELGHAVFEHYAAKLPTELRDRMVKDWKDWLASFQRGDNAADVARARIGASWAGTDTVFGKSLRGELPGSLKDALLKAWPDNPERGKKYVDYFTKFDEYAAEQFLKMAEADLAQAAASGKPLTPAQKAFEHLRNLVKVMKDLFDELRGKKQLDPSESFQEFFARAARGELQGAQGAYGGSMQGMAQPRGLDPIDVKYGLTALSGKDVRTRAERKAIRELIRMAEEEMAANPIDKEKTKTIMNNSLIPMATPGLRLALSNHPVAQWASRYLVENTMGGSGRKVTAAIRKAQYELEFVGNGNVIMDQAYESWKATRGVGAATGLSNDIFKGDLLAEFDSLVYKEIESRLWGRPSSTDPNVLRAADAYQVQYERMLRAQKENKTVGWSALPADSIGYVPHHLNAGKLGSMSNTRKESLRKIIEDQMVDILGFDRDFAVKLSGAYLDHARINANGGHEIPANVHDVHAPEYIAQAARAAGMTEDEIREIGRRLAAGGPSHTKRRLNLDLLAEHTDAEGTFTLMDMMDTDLRGLLRNQARRVAGEVALVQQGVQGSAGLKLIERALQFTPDGKVDKATMEAFQQVSAELLGRPYGDAMPTLAEGAMTANAAASLGQMVIPQLTETLNIATHLGLGAFKDAALSLPRLIKEVRILAKGGKVNNSILSTLEVPGGEFGMNDYKLVTRFDSPSAMYDTVGRDQLTPIDKLIRMTGRTLGKLSFHRVIQAAQVRASAEQITQKAIKFIRDGVESKALADMGITPELSARIKADLPNIAQFDPQGRIVSLDMTKAKDIGAVEDFISAINRGTGQIIQRSFVGEIGKWQHSTWGKVLTQFRTYPITAMEKQWGRQRGLHGTARAISMVISIMPFAVPIYLARVAINATGREDPDAYIDKMTTPLAIARGTMNYIGMLGLAPDFVDGLTHVPFVGPKVTEALGGGAGNARPGTVGSIVPLVGRADMALKAAQGDGGPEGLVRVLPFSNLPYIVPFVNALPNDW